MRFMQINFIYSDWQSDIYVAELDIHYQKLNETHH